jgi:N-acetylglucosaminyl-diphospho-decaprenol L-rhamnosyltransferase
MSTISTIIVSYNTRDLLRQCLASLRTTAPDVHVLVVDCASHDGSAEMVRNEFAWVTLVEPGANLGFTAANNLGLRLVLGDPFVAVHPDAPSVPESAVFGAAIPSQAPDYVLLLNPDTEVYADALQQLAQFLDQHPRVAMVGPRLLNPDASIQAAAFRFPTLSMSVLDLFPPGEVLPGRLYNSWWHGRYPQEQGEQAYPIDHPLGACMLVRREVIEQLGGLDQGFFMYAEELDWAYRMRQAGWSIWQLPSARVMHVGGASSSQFKARSQQMLYRSRMRFFRKHYAPYLVLLHTLIIRLGILRLILLAWRDRFMGRLTQAECVERVVTYSQIIRLTISEKQ